MLDLIDAADTHALELGLLLSQQQETFGINMLDAMLPSDQPEIDSLVFAGYSEIEAKQIIFENRYCKTDDKQAQREKYATISEYQLALRNSTMNAKLSPKGTSDDGSVNSRTSSRSSMRRVSFSEDLEQVKVFLSSEDKEAELDQPNEDSTSEVPSVSSNNRSVHDQPELIYDSSDFVVKASKPVSSKPVKKSWSLSKMFKSSSK